MILDNQQILLMRMWRQEYKSKILEEVLPMDPNVGNAFDRNLSELIIAASASDAY